MIDPVPKLHPDIVCIVDHKKMDLAAVALSYLFTGNVYVPVFSFPSVTTHQREYFDDQIDEHLLSVHRAEEFAVFVNNIIARMQSAETLILVGLSHNQKSFVSDLGIDNVIEVDALSDVDFLLGHYSDTTNTIACHPDDLHVGLWNALQSKSRLSIDEHAQRLVAIPATSRGLVIVEKHAFTSSLIAICYAFAINAVVFIVDDFADDEKAELLTKMEQYSGGDKTMMRPIKDFIERRLSGIEFFKYTFATFFTTGCPYSLAIENKIPCSYVHLGYRPDIFIMNGFLAAKVRFGGCLVFSPSFFLDEETEFVSKHFKSKGYLVKEMIGKKASAFALNMNLKEFPFDILHVCSHGGEVEGTTISEEFTDRDGNRHVVEYDQLLSFTSSLKKGYLTVQRMDYFKRFDGMVWASAELKAKQIPPYVFADMQNAMRDKPAKEKTILADKKKVPNSRSIQCSDGNFFGLFHTIASHGSPFVFNNTCWSWLNMAEAFLVSGASGYVGTLWKIGNKEAIKFAEQFYSIAENNTIMQAMHKAGQALNRTDYENSYIYWGLHFSRIPASRGKKKNRDKVYDHLMWSLGACMEQFRKTRATHIRDALVEQIQWIAIELATTFNAEDKKRFHERLNELRKNKKQNK